MAARGNTRPSRQERRPIEDWRPVILDTALQIIARDGVNVLSMEGISREIPLAKPRVYAAYPSLAKLLSALHERENHRVLTELDSVLASIGFDASFERVVEAMIRGLIHSAVIHPNSWRLLLTAGPGVPPALAERNDLARNTLRQRLTDFFQTVQGSGGLGDIDIELCARALVLLGEDAVHLVLDDADIYSAERFVAFSRWIARTVQSA